MKNQIFLFILLTTSLLSYSQIPFPHNAANSAGAERIANFGIQGINNQRLEITNATSQNGFYTPSLWGHNGSSIGPGIQIHGTTTSAYDTGSFPLIRFIASRPTRVNLNAPNGTHFPWGNGGTQQPVNNRPTFSWLNGQATVMLLSANNRLGLSTTAPTARLDVNGNARIRSIPTTNSAPYVLTVDASGNIKKQLKSSLPLLPSSSINTSNLSDRKYTENVKPVGNALETVLKLNGTTYNLKKDNLKNIEVSEKLQYGLIAQEVEEVLPELVNKDEINGYNVNYKGLIPVLIEAIKEQQNQITILSNKVSNFENEHNSLNKNVSNTTTKISNNIPNPFTTQTEIDLFIDSKVKDAKVIVFDANGSKISSYVIKDRGINTKFILLKKNLNSGLYFYTLIADGMVIGTKKMIIE